MRAICTAAFVAAAIGVVEPAAAHHSFAEFDTQRTVTAEGDVTALRWRNPHVTFEMSVSFGAGDTRTVSVEMESVGMLRRMGVGPDVMAVGDHVKVAGNPAFDGSLKLYAKNILLASGAELAMRGGLPRFADNTVGDSNSWLITQGSAAHPERGLFRVWSTTMGSQLQIASADAAIDPSAVLTPAAQRAIAAYDPIEISRTAGCKSTGVPRIMQQPDDMEFVDAGDEIVLRIEEFDTVRHIDMTPDADRADKPLSTLGYSTGAWDGRTLVVTTTSIAVPEIQPALPQSDKIETVERFTPSEDGSRLDYELTVTDPTYYTVPLHFTKYWIALEGVQIEPYDCVE